MSTTPLTLIERLALISAAIVVFDIALISAEVLPRRSLLSMASGAIFLIFSGAQAIVLVLMGVSLLRGKKFGWRFVGFFFLAAACAGPVLYAAVR